MPYGGDHDLYEMRELGLLKPTPKRPGIKMMILLLAFALAYLYSLNVIVPNRDARLKLHDQIVAGTAPAPYGNRLLVPIITNIVMEETGRDSFSYVYIVYCFLAITFSLFSMFIFWRMWFAAEWAFVGIVAFAFSYAVSMHYHYYQPWSHLEPGLVAMILWGIKRLNPVLLLGAALMVASRYCGLEPGHTASEAWKMGTDNIALTVVAHALFWNVIGIFAIAGFRHSPTFLRWSGLYVIPLLIAFFLFARWYEVRPLLSVMPVAIPYALSYSRRRLVCY